MAVDTRTTECNQGTAIVDLSGVTRGGDWILGVRGVNGKRVRARLEVDTS